MNAENLDLLGRNLSINMLLQYDMEGVYFWFGDIKEKRASVVEIVDRLIL